MRIQRANSSVLLRVTPLVLCVFLLAAATKAADRIGNAPKLTAESFDSGFEFAHDTYNGMGAGSDGKIYYGLCSEKYDAAGRMYCFDPATKRIQLLGDLTGVCGEKEMKAVAQGKIHNNFIERQGKLYFSTHSGYYVIVDDMEVIAPPPEGWKPYRGGHFLSYDPGAGKFKDFGIPLRGEGIITMNMDTRRGRLYGLTWPTAHFVSYDLTTKEMKDLGPTCLDGEGGRGERYRTICRSLAVDPTDGSVYFTNGDGDILRYDYHREQIEAVEGDNMRKDYFGLYDPTSPGHMGYNWRQVVWRPADKCFYGVHGNSGYLFRFDPRARRVTVLDRLTSLPSKRSGMFDQFSYGYLGFTLGSDGRTLYYLTGAPIYVDGRRLAGKDSTGKGEAKGLEDLHLITYDIPTDKYIDHGAIFLDNGQRPLYVNSIAVDDKGDVYTLCRIERGGRVVADLIRIPAASIRLENPLALRMANYGKFEPEGWQHLPTLGMHYVFLDVPEPENVAAMEKRLADHCLQPLVFRGATDLGRESSVEELAAQLALCEKMGVKYMFLSPKHTGVSKETACQRLREAGEAARKHGVTIALETHPDLGVNADAHLETMRRIDHPNVRVNFDTGNITFYNRGADAVAELKKVIDYVATVELKDHNGEYMDWNFPPLGKGVVDFPAVLKLLENHDYRGPITIEVEGVKGVDMDENQTKRYIAESISYVKSLGDFR